MRVTAVSGAHGLHMSLMDSKWLVLVVTLTQQSCVDSQIVRVTESGLYMSLMDSKLVGVRCHSNMTSSCIEV